MIKVLKLLKVDVSDDIDAFSGGEVEDRGSRSRSRFARCSLPRLSRSSWWRSSKFLPGQLPTTSADTSLLM